MKQVSGDFAWIINPLLLLSVESFELHKKSLGEIKYHANTSLKHAHLLKNSEKSGGFSTNLEVFQLKNLEKTTKRNFQYFVIRAREREFF